MNVFNASKVTVPQVVLVSSAGMSSGFSNELIHKWSRIPNNLIILPDRGEQNSMAQYLYEYWLFQQTEPEMSTLIQLNHLLKATYNYKDPLKDDALQVYIQEKETLKAKQKAEEILQKRQEKNEESDEEETQQNFSTETSHDHYLKPTSTSTPFFKSTFTFRMFPLKDPRKKFDDYGERIDVDAFIQGDYHDALTQAIEDRTAVKEIEEVKEEIPFTYKSEEREIEFKCKLIYIDFEARADGKSIRNIIPQIAPRKLVTLIY